MKKLNEKTVYDGQWLYVCESEFENRQGGRFTWETVHRKRSSVGVVVVARLCPSGRFILIKQHRAALNGVILSFPAGLGFDDPNQALVELKEETGYTGRIVDVSPVVKTGASLINDSARIIAVEVDETLAENQNPFQKLEEAEDIEVCLAGPNGMRDYILEQQRAGVHIAANLWYFFCMQKWMSQN
jgi:ADP-ribose pyrophosphatase